MRAHVRLIGTVTILAMAVSGTAFALDDPDPYFIDSNGDGIDGELNQAIFVAPPPLGNNMNSGMWEATAAAIPVARTPPTSAEKAAVGVSASRG